MQKPTAITRRYPRLALWLAYTGLFALLMGVWGGIFAANGRGFIWYGDTLKQHYAALMYYGRWLRGAAKALLAGSAVPTYDFTIGYGADVISTLSYYGLGDPLCLTAALVPSQHTEALLTALIVLRIYLGGLAFMAFSRYHGNGRFGTVLGAVAYVFGGWTLQTATLEPNFLIPLYCFPLILLGADRLFDGRRPTLYIAAIALAALSNFLFFYMMAVLLVLYALAKYLHRYGVRQLRPLPGLVGRFVLYSLVGIAVAGATLLPTVLEMFGSARFGLDRQVQWYPLQNCLAILANLTTSAHVDSYSTYNGITAAAVLAVAVLFARRRRETHLKWAWLALLAFQLIPWAGVALNGFSYMQNRWVWAFILLEAFIFARLCPDMAALTGPERRTLCVLLAGYCLLAFGSAGARTEWVLLGTAQLLLLALCLPGAGPRAARALLTLGCCLGIIANLGYTFGQTEGNLAAEHEDPGYAWQVSVVNNPANILKLLPDTGFWRYDSAMNEPINSAMLLGLHGTDYFWSLHDPYLSQLFSELGQNSGAEYDYRGFDGRAPMAALFGAKYYLAGADRSAPLPAGVNGEEVLAMDVGGTTVRVCENEAALPIGFTADKCLTRAQYESMSPVQRQDALLSAVLLEDGAAAALPQSTAAGRVQVPAAEVILGNGLQQLDEHTFYDPQGGGTLTFTVAAPPQNCESCFVVQGMTYTDTDPNAARTAEEWAAMPPAGRLAARRESFWYGHRDRTYLHLFYNGAEGFINYYKPNNQYYCGRHDFVYDFGCSEQGLAEFTIVLAYAGYYHFDSLTLEYQPVADLTAYTAPLRQEALGNVTLGANALTGDITVSSDKVLVVQLPYSRGWQAFVDGEPAEILRADTAFIGLALTPGSHTVTLRYKTPGLAAGTACTAAGMLAFVLIALAPRLRRARRRKTDLQPA